MLLVVERGEHDAADPEGATADGPVVAAVLAEVSRERVAPLGAGEDVGRVRVDGEEAAQDPGLDARQAPAIAARRQEARQVADGVAPLAPSDQGPQVGRGEGRVRLAGHRLEGALEALEMEEGEEAPVPDPPQGGVLRLRRAGEVVVAAIHGGRHRSADRWYEGIDLTRLD